MALEGHIMTKYWKTAVKRLVATCVVLASALAFEPSQTARADCIDKTDTKRNLRQCVAVDLRAADAELEVCCPGPTIFMPMAAFIRCTPGCCSRS